MRIMMPTAIPYVPKQVDSGLVGGRKTRPVTEEYYTKQLTQGCPHCGSDIHHTLKGKGIKPAKSRENFGGIFAYCKNVECSFATDERYYYISPTSERIDEFKTVSLRRYF